MGAMIDQLAAAVGTATEVVTVKLGSVPVRVLPQLDWRYEAIEAVQRGDFYTWALGATVNDLKVTPAGKKTGANDADAFAGGKFTVRELIQFLSDYETAAGITLGK